METINWSTLSLRERDGIVAEKLGLLEPDARAPYKMIHGEPVWGRAPKRKGDEVASAGMPVTCDHFTARWSGIKKIIAKLQSEWLDRPDAFTLEINVEASRLEVSVYNGASLLLRELSEQDNLPEVICRAALRYKGFNLV